MPILSDPSSAKLYVVAFLFAQLAPGWRTLLLFATTDILGVTYILNDDADGPGGVMGVAIAGLILFAFSAGLATRAATLCWTPVHAKPVRCALLTTLGFFVLPFWLWLDVGFTMMAAAAVFALPYGAWIFSIRAKPPRTLS